MNIEVMHAPAPRQVRQLTLALSPCMTVAQALEALSAQAEWGTAAEDARAGHLSLSIWGRRVALDEPLSDGDRLELCRGLLVDPKVARRERFKSQGTKSAGLFSKRRPGAKAGY